MLSGAGFVPVVAAQDSAAPAVAERRALEQLALGTARTALWAQVQALPLADGQTVGAWLVTDADAERAAHLWIRRQPAARAARLYSDGVCAVDVCVSADAVRDRLVELCGQMGGDVDARAVAARAVQVAARRWSELWATGSASLAGRRWEQRPVGWENITREGMELARRAAVDDAHAALLWQVEQLPLGPDRTLRAFIDSRATVRQAVAQGLDEFAKLDVQYACDGIAEGQATLAPHDLLRVLNRVHGEQYHGSEVALADFRGLVLQLGEQPIQATGLGVPPATAVLPPNVPADNVPAPAWAQTSLRAVGSYAPHTAETLSVDEQATAAWFAGLDPLRAQVATLELAPGVTVADFVDYHQDLKADMLLFISGARPVGAARTAADGRREVTVELPLARLWEIVRRKALPAANAAGRP